MCLTYNKMIDSVEDWAEVGGEGILHLWAAQLHQTHTEILNNVPVLLDKKVFMYAGVSYALFTSLLISNLFCTKWGAR